MGAANDHIDHLKKDLESLIKRQNTITADIKQLREQLSNLDEVEASKARPVASKEAPPKPQSSPKVQFKNKPRRREVHWPNKKTGGQRNLEKFIGENLISKIGIAVTIIGVIIGVKYSIDNNLISPLVRVSLGYLLGAGLLFTGFWLKEKYLNYSAVLVSGGLAIMYFITFAAYSFYDLVSVPIAFALMLVFTAMGVATSVQFKKQVITLIGLVGAYAIPFLLSPEEGNAVALLSYVAIINVGVLIIAFREDWQWVNYAAFVFTWLIFLGWFTGMDSSTHNSLLAQGFATLFFIIFYMMFLSYKILKKEEFKKKDIVLVLLNSFIYFGFGYAAIDMMPNGHAFLGLFAVFNAFVHLAVAMIINQQAQVSIRLYYFAIVLFLSFVTIAIPIQLKGNWTTLVWSAEAALLFWFGRTKRIAFYEKVSYPALILAFLALLTTWGEYNFVINGPENTGVIFNEYFLANFVFVLAVAAINYLYGTTQAQADLKLADNLVAIIRVALPALLLFTLFVLFVKEIDLYWENVDRSFMSENTMDHNLGAFIIHNLKTISVVMYTLVFSIGLATVDMFSIKNNRLAKVSQVLLTAAVIIFLIVGLYSLSELREGYLRETITAHLQHNAANIWVRYVAVLFFGAALYALYRYRFTDFVKHQNRNLVDIIINLAVIWYLSSELIHWLDMAGHPNSYKIWLSILWGSYSVFIIAWGIFYKRRHLRIAAIALLGVTLAKLAIYDISTLDTIKKTVVFVVLGLLLLTASFLYNKYKGFIFDEDGKDQEKQGSTESFKA